MTPSDLCKRFNKDAIFNWEKMAGQVAFGIDLRMLSCQNYRRTLAPLVKSWKTPFMVIPADSACGGTESRNFNDL
jgi:hypothetical protein